MKTVKAALETDSSWLDCYIVSLNAGFHTGVLSHSEMLQVFIYQL